MESPGATDSQIRTDAKAHSARSIWLWRIGRWVFAGGVVVFAAAQLIGHGSEFDGASRVFSHMRWWWLIPAVAVEGISLLSFARLQGVLLKSGSVRAPLSGLVMVTLATQAMVSSFPGGSVVALVYGYRWYRRFGADDTLAGWAILGCTLASVLSLAVLTVAGLALAFGEGENLDLVPAVLGLLAAAAGAAALFVYERPVLGAARRIVTGIRILFRLKLDRVEAALDEFTERVTAIRLRPRTAVVALSWGVSNWSFDCVCFALSFWVVGAGIPWRGLILAYGAGQLAANLPITPGGLVVVTGSITLALAYFDGSHVLTIYAVLVYRIISFWLVLLVGWSAWGRGAWSVRRGRWPRTLSSPLHDVNRAGSES